MHIPAPFRIRCWLHNVAHRAWPARIVLAFCCLGSGVVSAQEKSVATTVQLPTFGVAVDAEGLLSVSAVEDPLGRLRQQRFEAARRQMPGQLVARSALRKVSLVRLEQAIARARAAGWELDDDIRHLAGLQSITHVFCLPEQQDVIVAGPAEGWFADPTGRAVGMSTGAPVLLLEDLAVALRAFSPTGPRRPFLGCTIDPPVEGLTRLREFQKTIPKVVPAASRAEVGQQITHGIRESLGSADVRVFGVPPATHFAQVLVEADYRMKCIGIGLEPPPVKMTTFFAALDSPRDSSLQRWWFAPRYDGLVVSPDRQAVRFDGLGVRLLTEDKVLGPNGQIRDTAPPTGASLAYTKSFTEKYERIAAASPVYAQLRNMVQLAVVAAAIRTFDFYAATAWRAELLNDERVIPTETLPIPKRVSCLVNAGWKGNHFIAPAGGGVSIDAQAALDPELWNHEHAERLMEQRSQLARPSQADRWWWD